MRNKLKRALLFCITNRSDSWFVIVMQVQMRIFLTGMLCLSLYMLFHGESIGLALFVIGFSVIGIVISFMTISKSYISPGRRAYDLEQKRKEQRNDRL